MVNPIKQFLLILGSSIKSGYVHVDVCISMETLCCNHIPVL